MLVLTRRVNEEIVIDNHIHVRVISVRGNRVRLGITAEVPVSVLRHELLERTQPLATGPGAEEEVSLVLPGAPADGGRGPE